MGEESRNIARGAETATDLSAVKTMVCEDICSVDTVSQEEGKLAEKRTAAGERAETRSRIE